MQRIEAESHDVSIDIYLCIAGHSTNTMGQDHNYWYLRVVDGNLMGVSCYLLVQRDLMVPSSWEARWRDIHLPDPVGWASDSRLD